MNPFAHECKLKSCKMCSEMHAIDETPENTGVEETKHDQEDPGQTFPCVPCDPGV